MEAASFVLGIFSHLINTKPSKPHALSYHRPVSSFPRYIKLRQAVCLDETWFSSSFQLPYPFIGVTKSNLRIGRGCQALQSRAGYQVRGSLCFRKLCCVCYLLLVPSPDSGAGSFTACGAGWSSFAHADAAQSFPTR